MDTQYKSSNYATYSQYIAAPILICIFLYFIYALIVGKPLTPDELFWIPFFAWASVFSILSLSKLKYIEVRQDNILMKSLMGEKILEYKDIEWVNQNIFGSNWYIIAIKYKDNISGNSKMMIAFPEMYTMKENFTIFGESNITKYIREQIIRANQSYSILNEPSRWYLTSIIFGSLIPFLIISFMLLK
jgi:hypothetical protein